jgi:hypothetical protein
MYAFRYNPLVKRWVLLGGPIQQHIELSSAHFLGGATHKEFVAATYPKQPFLVEPPETFGEAPGLAYKEEPPVGEYELLLYSGDKNLADWGVDEWDAWLQLAQHRLLQLHHNPYLHHVQLTLRTAAEHSIAKFHWVGDLIATSHPIAGNPIELTAELAQKICQREAVFTLHKDEYGSLQVPSAPTFHDEVWYLPTEIRAGIEGVHGKERQAVAQLLAWVIGRLRTVHPHFHYALTIHTVLAGDHDDACWWFQLHREVPNAEFSALPIQPLPELVLQQLRYVLQSS